MWGHRVRVTTRRYDEGLQNAHVLEFSTGLQTRPLLRSAGPEERIRDGGTRVRVWLNQEPREKGGLLHPSAVGFKAETPLDLGSLCAWIAPSLDVDIYAEEGAYGRKVLAASDWITMNGADLLVRLCLRDLDLEERAFGDLLRLIRDSEGRVLGRVAIFPSGRSGRNLGAVTVGGLRGGSLEASMIGILVGTATRATRRGSVLSVVESVLADWASGQAVLISEAIHDLNTKFHCAASVLRYNGELGNLPIALNSDNEFFDCKSLALWKSAPHSIHVIPRISDFYLKGPGFYNVLHIPSVSSLSVRSASLPGAKKLKGLIRAALAQAWGCDLREIRAYIFDSQRKLIEIDEEDYLKGGIFGFILEGPVRRAKKPR